MLVALFEERAETRVVLTRRSELLRSHSGQVSFPGGRIEAGEGALAAALREATEEVGLDSAGVRVVGFLPPARAFSSGDPITPVVAVLDARPRLAASPTEVARVFDASLADLATHCRCEVWAHPGGPAFTMYVFRVEGEVVWGATARMIADLLEIVLDPGPGPRPRI
ncbi:MAG: NUDIX hydrolase [Acidimicrobiales bacterium]